MITCIIGTIWQVSVVYPPHTHHGVTANTTDEAAAAAALNVNSKVSDSTLILNALLCP